MAMNGTLLGNQIVAAIDAAVASNPTANAAQRNAIWQAIGTAIVAHITANAVVNVTVASVSGVTPGVGVSGPGVGVGTAPGAIT